MKTVIIAVLLLFSSVPAQDSAHVFILSGQSNMAQFAEVNFTTAVNFVLGEENTVIVRYAEPGQPILRWDKNWRPSSGDPLPDAPYNDTTTYGDLYDTLMVCVDTSVGATVMKTVTFLWMQGETDASDIILGGDVYEASLHRVLGQMKADLGRDDLHVVIGRISDAGLLNPVRIGSNPDWQAVRDAQVAVAGSDPRYGWVDTDYFNGPDHLIHYPNYGRELLAQSFADLALRLIMPEADEINGYSYLTHTYPIDSVFTCYDTPDSTAQSVYTDDFSDSNLAADPLLTGGLAWEQPDQDADYYVAPPDSLGNPALVCPYGYGTTNKDIMIKCTTGDTGNAWRNYAVDYRVTNNSIAYHAGEAGLMVLMNEYENRYLFSSGFGYAVFKRIMSGHPDEVLFACTQLETPTGESRYYRVVAEPAADAIRFYFGCSTDPDSAREIIRVCVDSSAAAVHTFGNGGTIGFYKHYPYQIAHQFYDDISVKVFSFEGDSQTTRIDLPLPEAPEVRLSSDIITDRLEVYTDHAERISIINAAGNELTNGSPVRNMFVWNTVGCPAGVYFVQVTSGRGRMIRRIIKTE